MPMLLITGARGQVGRSLTQTFAFKEDWDVMALDRTVLDITDYDKLQSIFKQYQFDWCINAAAYTAVDRAESEPELAQRINADAAGHLAKACATVGARMIQLSTDYVYHDVHPLPITETADTHPASTYARTKLEGEQQVLHYLPMAIILRTSWVYAPWGHNFVRTMLRLGQERSSLRVVADQIGTPTYAPDLAAGLRTMLNHPHIEAAGGIYHYSNEGVASWYDFALAIFELAGMAVEVTPIATADYPTAAERPPFSLLDKTKVKSEFGLHIPHWRVALQRCIRQLVPGN